MKTNFILFRLLLPLLPLIFQFSVSTAQTPVFQGAKQTSPAPSPIKLQDALRKLKTHYRVEILYAEKVVERQMSSLNSIDLTGSIEKNLSGLLHPIGLDFEKQNADSYIIVSRIKEIQKTEPDLKGIRNTTQMLASTSLQFPSTLARPFLPTPRPVERTISGTVKSSDTKEELPGVSVVLKGTARGTTTDVNGRFKLEIPEAEVILVFSYVGYTTQEVAVAASASALEVELKVDDKALEEVVVVDFGQQRKTDVIGSVVSVKPADLKVPSSNLTTALAGRVAGVISYQRSGEPGQDNVAFLYAVLLHSAINSIP